jgi:acyl-CoA thioester hydrolase
LVKPTIWAICAFLAKDLCPLVNLDFSYKRPLVYGDKALVEVTFKNTEAAKICFEYKIHCKKDGALIATGSSVQVFLDKNYQLVWNNPDFYQQWKEKLGLV